MRFSLALAGVLAMAANAVATRGPGLVEVDVDAQVKADIMAEVAGIKADIMAKVDGLKAIIVDVDVDVNVDVDVQAKMAAIDADVKVEIAGLEADIKAKIDLLGVKVKAGVDIKKDCELLLADIKVKIEAINAIIDARIAVLDIIKVKADVKVKIADLVASINADIELKIAGLQVKLDADIKANVKVDADIDVDVDVKAKIADLVDVDARVDLRPALGAGRSFRCPSGMSYCPWTRACACPPGQKVDVESRTCRGRGIKGAWPEPRPGRYDTHGVRLGSYCAVSPYRVVPYNAGHRYCRAGLDTITFVASADIALELAAFVDVDIDLDARISVDLKAVVAGLLSLYLESSVDAVALFNTDAFGLGVVQADVSAHVSLGLLDNLFCAVGLGKCHADCVSYCSKGCKNYIDVDADVGAGLEGLVGLAILPNVLLIVNGSKVVVSVAVNSLLCLLSGILGRLLSTLGCHC
ncbi:hypothetical protein XA68_15189 [Ophiocordyceps unilateralis]|uniref:Uncharacterized protein n=1 Tax=Ophiocordyceps unilateralis TaxID=268505 RepID=A0A2A9P7Q1_OPHUN|nr:hypothetical protein XA68_15189 [Ophiocordyceps unilateralis]